MIVGFLSFPPCTPSWRLNLIGPSWCELVIPVNDVKRPSTKRPQESLHWTFNDCRQRRAGWWTRRDLERSDHSSLRGLLVRWLCTCWHFSLRRQARQTAQLGSACLRAGRRFCCCWTWRIHLKNNPQFTDIVQLIEMYKGPQQHEGFLCYHWNP